MLTLLDWKWSAQQIAATAERQRYLERLDGKLLVVTNTDAAAADVITRHKSLADIEQGFRTLRSDIEIGPIYPTALRGSSAHMR